MNRKKKVNNGSLVSSPRYRQQLPTYCKQQITYGVNGMPLDYTQRGFQIHIITFEEPLKKLLKNSNVNN